ncbi:MAG: hypothetical protein AAGA85_14030 [Bacteroidota bacterium]
MKSDEFYIGWQDKEPPGYRRAFFRFFALAFTLMLAFAILFVVAERGFVDSYFDYGHLTEMKGRLVLEPVPALITEEHGMKKTVPLVGFGKFGAEPVVKHFQGQVGGDLSAYEVVLRGTIFRYQDKVWMELTEGEQSVLSYKRGAPLKRQIAQAGAIQLLGEIVDPKCFFGVMNPGSEAVHRSCAIRCISGGVPPLLALRENGEFTDYYFLTDDQLRGIHNQVLPYVGLPMQLSGEVVLYDDWKVLKIDDASLTASRIFAHGEASLSLCME